MERLKRTFSMRKKRDTNIESNKPHQWQEDERKVREGTCSFQVKYLGCIEVFESRGIQICEEAVKALKSKKRRSAWSRLSFRKKRGSFQQSKSSHHRAILYVTGDALRVVDEISKGLIVDQTIEKVSFCAPDRNHEKGFAYICRDGTTRRWMCHGFLAVKESGERLSHAVGCAFAICLEKKQAREKEKVTVTFSENGTSFTRMGSFRQTTLTERLADPQSAIVAEPVPVCKIENPYAVQRPHASADMLERQGSFRGFTRLADSSPFKRNISLRLNELPSTLERQRQVATGILGPQQYSSGITGPASANTSGFGTIMEAEEHEMSPVSDACHQLTEGLSALSARDGVAPLTSVPATVTAPAAAAITFSSAQSVPPYAGASGVPQPALAVSGVFPGHPAYNMGVVPAQPMPVVVGSPFTLQHNQPLNPVILNHSVIGGQQFMPYGSPQIVAPSQTALVNNPWSRTAVQSAVASPSPPVVTAPTQSQFSDAEYWLNSTASQIDPFAAVPNVGGKPAAVRPRVVNGSADLRLSGQTSPHTTTAIATVHHPTSVTTADQQPPSFISTPVRAGEQIPAVCQPGIQTVNASRPLITSSSGVRPVDSQPFDPFDSAFDSAWAAKTSNRSATSMSAPVNNPFQTSVDKVMPAFEVKL